MSGKIILIFIAGIFSADGYASEISSISREEAQQEYVQHCHQLLKKQAFFVEEKACYGICGTFNSKRKLCFYTQIYTGGFVSDEKKCQQLGGKINTCTPSVCDGGICTSDCRVACEFQRLTKMP